MIQFFHKLNQNTKNDQYEHVTRRTDKCISDIQFHINFEADFSAGHSISLFTGHNYVLSNLPFGQPFYKLNGTKFVD